MTPAQFRKKVLAFYAKNGRDFPWRWTTDPYKILVSEVMLQQTQTHRVTPKYELFIKKFPNIKTLAQAPLSQVLKLWQGLGYNRRAVFLHRAAQRVASGTGSRGKGRMPASYEELCKLPGIGPYTAGAIMAFAYNQPVVIIETNIRAALIHEFFPRSKNVRDERLLPILRAALPREDARRWYQALMDYGAFIKQKYPNPSRRSAHHTKQSKFEGSDRQIRGGILRLLTQRGSTPETSVLRALPVPEARGRSIVQGLVRDGLVARRGKRLVLPK